MVVKPVRYVGGNGPLDVHDSKDGSLIGTVANGEALDVPAHVFDDLTAREDFSAPETKAQREAREQRERDEAEEKAAAEKAAAEAIKKVRAERAKKETNR